MLSLARFSLLFSCSVQLIVVRACVKEQIIVEIKPRIEPRTSRHVPDGDQVQPASRCERASSSRNMPKSRNKNTSSKNASATTAASKATLPLLDSLRGQVPATTTASNGSRSVESDWQCDANDWSDEHGSRTEPDAFPRTLRSIERQHEQAKNRVFPPAKSNHDESPASTQIDVRKLSSIVTDLIGGKEDRGNYAAFLAVLQNFSVRTSRDDHLEETTYHLIQAAVSFIRANSQRFDPAELDECYRRRHALKANANH